MAVTVNALKRVFKFKGTTLKDPDLNMSPTQVRDHYMNLYPDMLNTSVAEKSRSAKSVTYEIKPKVGTHG